MRIFSINFNGGFAIVDNSTAMMNIKEWGKRANSFTKVGRLSIKYSFL